MKLPPFEYARPTSIAEAVALLASHGGDAKPLAFGDAFGAADEGMNLPGDFPLSDRHTQGAAQQADAN